MPTDVDEGGDIRYVMNVGTNGKDTYRLEKTAEEEKKLVDEVCLKYLVKSGSMVAVSGHSVI